MAKKLKPTPRTKTLSEREMKASRRGFLAGLGAVIAAPAIVKADRIMRVRGVVMPVQRPTEWSMTFEEWEPGQPYAGGDIVLIDGVPFIAIADHVATHRGQRLSAQPAFTAIK